MEEDQRGKLRPPGSNRQSSRRRGRPALGAIAGSLRNHRLRVRGI